MSDIVSSAAGVDTVPRFAIAGDINGELTAAFKSLNKVQEKAKNDFLIIAGNLFAEPDEETDADAEEIVKLLDNQIEIPLPTYFALGKRPLPQAIIERLRETGGEVCPNLSILGRNVSLKTTEGIHIVAIGGAHTARNDDLLDDYAPFHTEKDIERAKQYKDVDILITADWPERVRDGDRSATTYGDGVPPAGDRSIAELCSTLKPRYHFSTSKAPFTRAPFFHAGEPPLSVTRFESLPPRGSPLTKKWVVAKKLPPPSPELPQGCTASPFKINKKRKLPDQAQAYAGFQFSTDPNASSNGSVDSYRPNGRGRGRGGKRARYEKSRECYFCFHDNTAGHMAFSIGDDAYLTVAKGPLTLSSSFPDLNVPAHILIIAMSHQPTLYAMGDERERIFKEMERYREALQTLVSAKSSDSEGVARLGAVTYEISRAGSFHLHWQFLPMPAEMINKGVVEVAFDVEAENLSYGQFAKTAEDVKAVEESGDYFKAWIWTETGEKVVALSLKPGMKFDLQFGRSVLGKLLGLEKRRDWKDCLQTTEEETRDAEAFGEMFNEYDFTGYPDYGQ